VQHEIKERWQLLCQQAAVEQDHEKFLAIIRELNEVLEKKELRLRAVQKPSGEQPAK
jgi:hypothetical protein